MMQYTDRLINTYDDPAFQTAFRRYVGELGVKVTNWAGLFAGMGEKCREYTWTHRDETGRVTSFTAWMNEDDQDHSWVRKDENGEAIGFIQFTTMDMGSWFFRARCGFIREFWIREELRRQGHGSALLRQAEDWLREQGCLCVLLTTDTAPGFYEKQGYTRQTGIEARNKDAVFTKMLK